MSYFGFTDTGNIRGNNEDSFAVKTISENFIAAVVADGMGGHRGGKEASSYAVEAVIKAIEDAAKFFEKYSDRQIENFLKNTVIKVNKSLYLQSTEDKSLSGMGTTLVVCIIYSGKYYIANVGDSRLYIYSDKFTQITKDHSYVSELLEMGLITEEQAQNHPNKNVITRAVGTESTVQPDIYKGKIAENDTVLICTDGLTNMVSDDVISNIIAKKIQVADITNELVSLAKQNGGTDNITVVTLRAEKRGEPIL